MMDQSASSSSSGSYKRARLPSGGNETQVASCLVDGCNSDLSKGRDYHRRHKVCELHSKTPRVTIRGLEQRFCQQCSRFHSLGEFDEGKRSCRKRLDGHNRRRRKPQVADSLSLNSANAHQGGARILNFETRQMYQPRATMSSTWSISTRDHGDSMFYNSHTQLNLFDGRRNSYDESLLHAYREVKPDVLSLQCTDSGLHQALQNPRQGGNSGSNKMFSDGLDRAIASSDHAPSLLSSSSQSETRGFFPGQMVQLGLTSLTQSSIPRAQFSGSGSENRLFGDNFPPHGASGNSNVHCQELFQISPDGSSSANGTEKTISFSWQ